MMRRGWTVGLLAPLLVLVLLWQQRAQHDHSPMAVIHPLESPERAQQRLGEIFAEAGPEAHELVAHLMAALRRQEYEAAVENLLSLRQYTGNTYDTWQRFNGVYIGLQQDVASRAARGDAAAIQAAELFKNLPCCVH